MNNIVGLDLNINQDFISETVKQTVLMGISESLNGKNEIVSQIVKMVLTQKVSDKGTISSYERDNKYTLLEYYVSKMIKEVTQEEMNNLVQEHREEIASTIKKELNKKTNLNKFVDRFIGNVSDSVDNSWCPKIDVNFEQKKEHIW